MTEKDKEIQDLRKTVTDSEKVIRVMVESYRICRFCKYLDADCTPFDMSCHPEWNGMTN